MKIQGIFWGGFKVPIFTQLSRQQLWLIKAGDCVKTSQLSETGSLKKSTLRVKPVWADLPVHQGSFGLGKECVLQVSGTTTVASRYFVKFVNIYQKAWWSVNWNFKSSRNSGKAGEKLLPSRPICLRNGQPALWVTWQTSQKEDGWVSFSLNAPPPLLLLQNPLSLIW